MNNKIVWKEGLFIRPQHFQQTDRYFTYELMTRTIETGSNNWGFFDLSIDTHLLSTGKVVIKHAAGILPDGTLFNIEAKHGGLVLNIKNDDLGKSIYLALPVLINNSNDVHFEDQENILTRFRSVVNTDIHNTNAGENSVVDILTAQHNFKLLLEDELNDGFIKIKISEISSVSASGVVSLEENYIPTFLHINKSDGLVSQLNELMSMLTYRAEKLSEKISHSVLQTSELGNYLMLQLLNKTETRFHFLFTQDKIHPQDVFLELTSLASELAVFMKKEKKLTEQFTYTHENIGICFLKIIDDLKEMLSMVLEQNSISLPIEARKYGIHVAQIKDKKLLENSSFIFSVTADASTESIKETLMANLKIGSIETIRNLVNYHLVGFTIKPLSSPPREIPYRVNHLYFKIDLKNEDRIELKRSGGFAFHLSSELSNIAYGLWAIRNN